MYSAKFKPITSSTPSLKIPKNYIKNLQEQLQKSRIAVENITECKNQESMRKKISQIQKQLHSCMMNMHNESKKQKVLQQLITLLKNEMLKFQTIHKQQEQEQSSHHEKKVKKIEYDIQQILQKHNEQVAKINLLKEQANCCRSERVVFSNLFKKLQKQIKHFQQIYKEQLIKTEAVTAKKAKQQIQFQRNFYSSQKQQDQVEQEQFLDTKQIQSLQLKQKNSIQSLAGDRQSLFQQQNNGPFITISKNNNIKINNIAVSNSLHQTLRQQSKHSVKNLKEKIDEVQKQIEKMTIYSQCQGIQEIINHYSGLQEQNQQLIMNIQSCIHKIESVKKQNEAFKASQEKRQFWKKMCSSSNIIPLGSNQGLSSESNISKKVQQPNTKISIFCDQKTKIVKEIYQMFNLNYNQNEELLNDEYLQNIDYKLDLINYLTQKKLPLTRQFTSFKKQQTGPSQNIVEGLLDRMEKFQECQKILDKGSFQQEYYRQLCRGKRSCKSKNKML